MMRICVLTKLLPPVFTPLFGLTDRVHGCLFVSLWHSIVAVLEALDWFPVLLYHLISSGLITWVLRSSSVTFAILI